MALQWPAVLSALQMERKKTRSEFLKKERNNLQDVELCSSSKGDGSFVAALNLSRGSGNRMKIKGVPVGIDATGVKYYMV